MLNCKQTAGVFILYYLFCLYLIFNIVLLFSNKNMIFMLNYAWDN